MANNTHFKALFEPIEGIYALSHSVGPLPKVSRVALNHEYFDTWSQLGGDAWAHWLTQIDGFCQSVAALIDTKSDAICPQTNLASGFSAFLTALAKLPELSHKKTILMHEDAFPSMGFVVSGLANSHNLELVLVKGEPNDQDIWLTALETHQVMACLFTHVHSNTSIVSDIGRLCQLAKEHNAFALVDVAQSIGILPVNVPSINADAIFGSCVKWLCGGPGAGFKYVEPTLIEQLQPDTRGWFSHQNPFEFDITHFRFADTAKRFFGGTPSVAPFVTAKASIDLIASIGQKQIYHHNLMLKQRLVALLPEKYLPQNQHIDEQGGTLCLPVGSNEKILSQLRNAGVKFDERQKVIRLSLHIINTLSEVEAIAECFN